MDYRKIDDEEQKLIKNASKITCTNYFDNANEQLISIDALFSIIEDLIYEVDGIKEELEDFKQDVDSNYRRLSVEEIYD